MEIYAPNTKLTNLTKFCLKDYEYIPIPLDDNEGYWQFFKDRWDNGRKFISVEQDIGFYPGALEAIWNCPANWCTYGYDMIGVLDHPGSTPPLGLVKFNDIFIGQTKTMFDELPSRNWRDMDSGINNWVKATKGMVFGVHLHYPSVINFHEQQVSV